MKNSFIKNKINGISWYTNDDLLKRNSLSREYIFDKLKYINANLFFLGHNVLDEQTLNNQKLKNGHTNRKQFFPIKAGRRKVFGQMNLLDENGENDVFIKIFNSSSLLLKLKHIFIPSKAIKEFDLSCKINKSGIPAVFTIAAGNEKRFCLLKRSYLIVKKINNVVNLTEFFYDPTLKPGDKHIVLEQFGKIARQSHEKGIFQTDFALNNFLVKKISENEFRIYLIDYERTKICRRISEEKKFWILAKLNRVGSDFSICDKLRFLRSYLSGNQKMSVKLKSLPNIKKLMIDLELETIRILQEGAFKVWKGCIKGERRFSVYSKDNFDGYFLSNHKADIFIDVINDFERYKKSGNLSFCSSAEITSAVTDSLVNYKDQIFKIYRIKSNDSEFIDAFWQNSNALLKARLNIIEPFGLFIKEKHFKEESGLNHNEHHKYEGYLITPYIHTMQDIKEFLDDISNSGDRKLFLRKLARFICSLRNFGYFADNLFPDDIVVNIKNNKYEFYFMHTYNFVFNSTLQQNKKDMDIKKVVIYFGDKINDDEKNFLQDTYTRVSK